MKTRMMFALLITFLVSAFCVAQDAQPSPSPQAAKPKPTMSKRQIQRDLIKLENAMWQAWKDKDTKVFRARVAGDGLLIGEQGIATREEMIKGIQGSNCDVKSFALSDFKLISVGSNTYFLAYKGTEEGTCDGTALPSTLYGSSTWVRRQGKWFAVTHQETAGK